MLPQSPSKIQEARCWSSISVTMQQQTFLCSPQNSILGVVEASCQLIGCPMCYMPTLSKVKCTCAAMLRRRLDPVVNSPA